jgi:hypothetical protein
MYTSTTVTYTKASVGSQRKDTRDAGTLAYTPRDGEKGRTWVQTSTAFPYSYLHLGAMFGDLNYLYLLNQITNDLV